MSIQILTKQQIFDWLNKLYIIPADERNITMTEFSRQCGIPYMDCYAIYKGRTPMQDYHQIRMSHAIKVLGEPKQISRKEGRKISRSPVAPEEIYARISKAVGDATYQEYVDAMGYDNHFRMHHIQQKCRAGETVYFRYSTLVRLYKKLFKVNIVPELEQYASKHTAPNWQKGKKKKASKQGTIPEKQYRVTPFPSND